jgi:hypothetical protein
LKTTLDTHGCHDTVVCMTMITKLKDLKGDTLYGYAIQGARTLEDFRKIRRSAILEQQVNTGLLVVYWGREYIAKLRIREFKQYLNKEDKRNPIWAMQVINEIIAEYSCGDVSRIKCITIGF